MLESSPMTMSPTSTTTRHIRPKRRISGHFLCRANVRLSGHFPVQAARRHQSVRNARMVTVLVATALYIAHCDQVTYKILGRLHCAFRQDKKWRPADLHKISQSYRSCAARDLISSTLVGRRAVYFVEAFCISGPASPAAATGLPESPPMRMRGSFQFPENGNAVLHRVFVFAMADMSTACRIGGQANVLIFSLRRERPRVPVETFRAYERPASATGRRRSNKTSLGPVTSTVFE